MNKVDSDGKKQGYWEEQTETGFWYGYYVDNLEEGYWFSSNAEFYDGSIEKIFKSKFLYYKGEVGHNILQSFDRLSDVYNTYYEIGLYGVRIHSEEII